MRIAIYNHTAGEVGGFFSLPSGETEAKGKFTFPNGDSVRPIVLGWKSPDGWEESWEVVEVVPFALLEGKVKAGAPSYEIVDGKLIETCPVEDKPAPQPIDFPLEPFEFHAMIEFMGRDSAIRSAIASIDNDLERAVALKRYEQSKLYHRDDALLASVAVGIGMTDQEIDDAWMQIVGLR